MFTKDEISVDKITLDRLIYIPCALVRTKRKRCYDVTLSIQEGSTTRHLASALVLGTGVDRRGDTGRLFLMFGGPVCADRNSICPLDRMY